MSTGHFLGDVTIVRPLHMTCPLHNSCVETAEYLINKHVSIFILINIKNCTYWYLALDDFFQRSVSHKQHVNEKQNLPNIWK